MFINHVLFANTPTIPVSIQTFGADIDVSKAHTETELFFNLYGNVEVLVSNKASHVCCGDVILVNSNEPHIISGQRGEFLSIRFDLTKIPGITPSALPIFDVNSSGQTDSTRFDPLRRLIARMVEECLTEHNPYHILSLLYELIGLLESQFLVEKETYNYESDIAQYTKKSVAEYIESHFREGLTLQDLSDHFHLSIPHISSSFKKYFGTTFLNYYNDVRLSHCVYSMLTTDLPLEDISYENGFRDSRSFVAAFKKKYNVLPSVYRAENAVYGLEESAKTDFVIPPEKDVFQSLTKYLKPQTLIQEQDNFLPKRSISAGNVSFSQDGIRLRHTMRKMCSIEGAHQLLYADIQEILRKVQKDIGYEYIYFHGLLSDEMHFCFLHNQEYVYSYVLIDKVLDFLMQIHLKPVIEFSFLPSVLAKHPEHALGLGRYITSEPTNISAWKRMIDALTRHLIARYGISEVRTWLFTVWNEPNTPVSLFGWHDYNLFFEFYRQTYVTVKEIDQSLLFGSPSLFETAFIENPWDDQFFDYCTDYKCIPDFINLHYYDNEIPLNPSIRSNHIDWYQNKITTVPLSSDPNSFSMFLSSFKRKLDAHQFYSCPIYLTAWNMTISQRDPINDTCYKSCYMTKNLLKNYDRLESFSYYSLSDFTENFPLPNSLFHGGQGLFTYNAVPKAFYHTLRFFNDLCDTMIFSGNGCFITKNEHKITMLLYNYEHISPIMTAAYTESFLSNSRYETFLPTKNVHAHVKFTDLPYGSCIIRESYVNQDYGSSFHTWKEIGANPNPEIDDLKILRTKSEPGLSIRKTEIYQGSLEFETTLAPYEVRLVEIRLV